jgi:uncharacterized membrane protein
VDKPPQARLAFLDLLRGSAILFMIETHAFNTMLLPSLKASHWFRYLTFVNGLVAPSFLFVSGWVFAVASGRKLDALRCWGPVFRKQLGRILLIWGLGYALHFPFYSYSRTKALARPDDWLRFCQMDILQCIAVGLLLLLMGRIFIKSSRSFEQILLASSILVVFSSPFLGQIDFLAMMPMPLALYFQEQSFSYFPLFPWLGFMLLGGLGGVVHTRAAASGNERRLVGSLGLVAVELVLAGIVFWEIPHWIPHASSRVTVNPFFFLMRLGCVTMLLVACWHYALKCPHGGKFVREISRESLLVYVLHILIIYRLSWNNQSLSSLYRGSLNLWESSALVLLLALLMWVSAKCWSWVKFMFPAVSRALAFALVLIAMVVFFVN